MFLAMFMNLEGNADILAWRVSADIDRRQLNDVVDPISGIIGPKYREGDFINTLEAWNKLQSWDHRPEKGFEKYHLAVSHLSADYLQLHTAAEENVSVRELIALSSLHVFQGTINCPWRFDTQENETDKALESFLLQTE